MATIIQKRNPKLVVQMCFGSHDTPDFARVAPLIEKYRPDVIGGEAGNLTCAMRSQEARAFRRRVSGLSDLLLTLKPLEAEVSRTAIAMSLFKGGDPGFIGYERAEAARIGAAWFPIEANKP